MNKISPKKILVVVLDNLGDAILGTCLLKPLKKIYPNALLGIWVKKYASGIFEDQTLLDRVHAADPYWDTSPGHPKGDKREFRSVLRDVRREKYDLAFLLNTEWRRSLAAWWAGIPNRVGFNRRKSKFFLSRSVAFPKLPEHFVDDHRLLLEAWTGEPVAADLFVPRIDLSTEEKKWGAVWETQLGWKGHPVVLLHPFAGDPLKCWPAAQWSHLIDSLYSANRALRFVLVGGAGEVRETRPTFGLLPESIFTVLAGAPLAHVKALIARSQLVIGGDSGPGHLAAAMGVPVLSLFGSTEPGRCGPRGPTSIRILRRIPLADLSVHEVAIEAGRLLDARREHKYEPA